jgi:PAS domain S-box-containing protein
MTMPQSRSDALHENLLEFERLISDTSASLLAAPLDDLGLAVEHALNRVRKFFGADRCVLLSVSPDHAVVKVGPGSYGEGIEPVSPEINLAELFPWSRHRLLVERAPIRVSRMADLPPEAEVERESWNLMGIRSALTLPIESDGLISHLILLNSVHRECEWPDAFVTRLRVLGEMLVGALERQRMFRSCRESENRLNLAADLAAAGLWSVDTRTREVWGTERLRGIFGYPPGSALTLEDIEAAIHPDDLALVRTAMAGLTRDSDVFNLEYRIVRPDDGAERWLKSRGRPYFGALGDPEFIMGVSIDITDQKINEIALRTSELRLAKGADLAGLAFYEVDFQAGTLYFDPALRDLIGLPPARDRGLGPLEFWMEQLHPDDRPRVMRLRQELHEGNRDQLTLDYRFMKPDAGQIWIQHLAAVSTRDADGIAVATYGVLRETTKIKTAQEELHELSRLLIHAQEDERALLARELHDDVTQRLAVLAIGVGRSESTVGDPLQAEALRGVREEIVRLSEDIHALAYHLHPTVLTELGLVEALRAEADRRNRQGQIKVSVEHDLLPSLPGKDEALCLFRVAQEALNNVARHAGTDAAKITLRQSGVGLLLAVTDGGIGFNPDLPCKGKHLGLVGMRERVRLVHGWLDIESVPGRGTTISAWVPCEGVSP